MNHGRKDICNTQQQFVQIKLLIFRSVLSTLLDAKTQDQISCSQRRHQVCKEHESVEIKEVGMKTQRSKHDRPLRNVEIGDVLARYGKRRYERKIKQL